MTPNQIRAAPFFRPADEELRFLPEGPRVLRNFPGARAKLGWVAIQHGADSADGSLNVLDLATLENRSLHLKGRPGFFAETTRPGCVLVGLERSLVYVNLVTGVPEEEIVQVTGDERVIINDGLAVEGGVLFGTKHLKFNEPLGALYFFDSATQQLQTVLGGQFCSNGKFLRRDAAGATLIDIDTIPKAIGRYRLDAQLRCVFDRASIIEPDALPALPDGLRPAPACEGAGEGESAIVAFYNPEAAGDGVAWQLRLRDGAKLCEWLIPGSPRVTCPEFVEIAGEVKLVFTTAVEDMPYPTRRRAVGAGTMYLADTPFDTMPSPPPLVPYRGLATSDYL